MPGVDPTLPGYSAYVSDPSEGSGLMLQCSQGLRGVLVSARDVTNSFNAHGEPATVYLQVGSSPTTTHAAIVAAKRDGTVVLDVDAKDFADRIVDGEVRFLVTNATAHLAATFDVSGSAAALAPLRSCRR